MTEPKTVYVYVDLYDGSWTPCSGWDGLDGRHHVKTDWTFDDGQDRREYVPLGLVFVAVRGARALEIAEREVSEAVEPFRNGRTFVSCKCVQSETHVIWLNEAPSHIGREVYQEQSRVLWRAVDLRDRLRAKLSYAVDPNDPTRSVTESHDRATFSVEYARRSCICRLCGLPPERGPGLPFVYDHGREYAHEACLKQKYMHAKPDKPSPSVHWIIPGTVGPACWTANGLVASPPFDLNNHPEFVTCLSCKMVIEQVDISPDVKRIAVQIGREIVKSLNQESKPMPEKPKPDPHAECRLSLRDGHVEDDYGRRVHDVASVRVEINSLTGPLMEVNVVPSFDPPAAFAPRPVPATPEPVYITMTKPLCEEAMSSAFRAANEMESKLGRKVVVVPYAGSVDNPIAADIARRADIHARARKAWRAGVVVGLIVLGFILIMSAIVLGYYCPVPRQHASEYHDEHAKESEDVETRAK